ncbi:MAG: CotH kinase family protein [Planctomycetota bacterium]|jgi:hypothetical protein|nr:CotH kinase family protein [Planctomycetota bacterium]
MRSLLALIAIGFAAPLAAQYPQPLDNAAYADAQDNIYLRDEVTQVIVTMDPGDLQFLLDNRDTDVYADCTVRIINSQIDETYANVGIRPRGNTARDAKKNAWKLSFNEFVPGRTCHGLKKFNLGGDAPDPSISRSSTTFDFFRAMGVPAPRTHHVWLTINDGADVEGVFVNFEQVDEIFLKAWFGNNGGRLYKCRNKGTGANLTYRGTGLPSDYEALLDYEEENGGDFQLLADFIDFINNSASTAFATDIGEWLNTDGFLRAQAVDVISGQWDGLWIGANNYYLYENTDTGRLEYIPWDLDHSIGMDYLFFPIIGNFGTDFATKPYQGWGNRGFAMSGNEPPPLIERMLDIANYDSALKAYCREAAAGPFHPNNVFGRLDQLKTMLSPIAFTGAFSGSSMDNGYTNNSFNNSFTSPGSYSLFNTPATWGLKPFITKRREYVANNYPTPPASPQVFINEVMADNETTLADEAGEFDDWVEIYNDEDVPMDISGWYLSDDAGNPREWTFPAGTIVPAKGYVIVWCDNDPLQGPLHTTFKLTSDGEGVYLWLPDSFGHIQADSLLFPGLGNDESFGRFPDGTVAVETFTSATPEATNASGGFALRVTGNCPGELTFHAGGATPGGTVVFVGSIGGGSFPIPSGYPCAGSMLGLDSGSATIVGQVTADANGQASMVIDGQESYSGSVVLQALDVTSCNLSSAEEL